jgi:Family of unknown function (DUF6455)
MKTARSDLANFHRRAPMDDMMQVTGVDILAAIDVDGGQSYVRARANCHQCPSKEICRDWLLEHLQGEPQDFCPNADFFRAIQSEAC